MNIFGVLLLVLSSLMGGYMYRLVYLSRHRISERVSFTVALAAGQLTSFVIAMTLYWVIPMSFTVICSVNLWLGIGIGVTYGSMTGMQSVVAGFFYGGVAAIMGTMVGAAAFDPTLCGLPASTLGIQNTGFAVGIIGLLLLGVTTLFVRFSFTR
ncbi:hypothetical protein [Sporosarcina sp. NPDC096371]|uniref:hypothetical protein n=1 Tax=Sporosarcina sp. NPDC096371 TaxID=3364530 RepID=UPI0038250AA4